MSLTPHFHKILDPIGSKYFLCDEPGYRKFGKVPSPLPLRFQRHDNVDPLSTNQLNTSDTSITWLKPQLENWICWIMGKQVGHMYLMTWEVKNTKLFCFISVCIFFTRQMSTSTQGSLLWICEKKDGVQNNGLFMWIPEDGYRTIEFCMRIPEETPYQHLGLYFKGNPAQNERKSYRAHRRNQFNSFQLRKVLKGTGIIGHWCKLYT